MTTIYILLACLAVMLISLAGIFTVTHKFRGWAERNLKYLATFATGVFVVVAYNLVAETFHSNFETTSLLLLFAGGALIAFIIDKIIPDSHHHHDNDESSHTHSKAGAQRIILSDALHNITDGFLIVPAFLVDIKLGLLTTAGIMIHEVALEISEFFVMKSAGYSTKKALTVNFITSGSIIIGALAALFITNISEDITFTLLAIAAGIIIYTIIKDLIPHSYAVARKEKTYSQHLIAALAGALIIIGITTATAETHVHEEGTHSEESHMDHHEEHLDEMQSEEVHLEHHNEMHKDEHGHMENDLH